MEIQTDIRTAGIRTIVRDGKIYLISKYSPIYPPAVAAKDPTPNPRPDEIP
mgnify:CR=1 FL=1